jgi:uncharacterized membrane protein HdeD (DUF308 family)
MVLSGQVEMVNSKSNIQLIWGIALLLVGLAVFFRIPQVMPRIAQLEGFSEILPFIRVCFYFMGVILVGGGIRKIWLHFQRAKNVSN